MSTSTASACDAEPTLRAFILGNLEDTPSLGVDDPEPFPDLARDIDETELDLSGICAWLEASAEPGVAPDAPRCAHPERDGASFLRDGLVAEAPQPRPAKRRRARDGAETTLGETDALIRENARHATACETRKASDASSRDDSADDEKSRTSARLRRNRESAAASRARKKNETAALRRTVRELEKANAHLSYAAQCAFAENAALRCRLGFSPSQNIAGPPPPPPAGPGFLFPDAPARLAESSHQTFEATEPAALERPDRKNRPLPVMPCGDDVPSSSWASLRALVSSLLFSRVAPPRDVRSRLRLGARRLARRRSRATGVATWDAAVDKRVLTRRRGRRGDGGIETRRRDGCVRFPKSCVARLRALSAPRRAARIRTRASLSRSRFGYAQPAGGFARVAQTLATVCWSDTKSSRRS